VAVGVIFPTITPLSIQYCSTLAIKQRVVNSWNAPNLFLQQGLSGNIPQNIEIKTPLFLMG
jgi:hypothetical protein